MDDRYVRDSFSVASRFKVDLELSTYEDDDKVLIDCSHRLTGYNRTVSANGTKLVPLNLASKDFLGQLNFNYTASDGRPQVFLSPVFAVHDSPQPSPVIWSQGVLAAPTPSPSAVPQTSILKSAAPSSLSVSKSSTTNNSRLGIGAIAGIVIGIVVCVGLAGSLVFYRRRRPNKIQAEVETLSLTDFQSPILVNIIGGTDVTSLHLPELSGDGQLVEMATSYHEDMNVSTGLA